jgi:hypothetical protein
LHSKSDGARSSYFICRDENNSLQVDAGESDSLGYEKPGLLAVIRTVLLALALLECFL